MVAVQGGRIYLNSFLAGYFFFFKIDRDGVSIGDGVSSDGVSSDGVSFRQGEPAVGGDHQVMGSDDGGIDDEFGFEIARVIIDGGVVGAAGWDGYSAAHVPGLDDEYGVGGADGSFIMEDDGVRDAFGHYFVGGEGVLGWIGS